MLPRILYFCIAFTIFSDICYAAPASDEAKAISTSAPLARVSLTKDVGKSVFQQVLELAKPHIKDPLDLATKGPNKLAHIFDHFNVDQLGVIQGDVATSWPLGIVRYKVNVSQSAFDKLLQQRIESQMEELEKVSCLRFQEKGSAVELQHRNSPYLFFTNPKNKRECTHRRETMEKDGRIKVVVGLDCMSNHDLMHTLLHGIGFVDEVGHPQRDKYIRVVWENIQPKYRTLFRTYPNQQSFVTEYDPQSVMHFHDRAFSANGHATIASLVPGLQIRPSDTLSQLDKMRLRLAFNHECNKRRVSNLLNTCQKAVINVPQDDQGDKAKDEQKADVADDVHDDGAHHDDANQDVANQDEANKERDVDAAKPDVGAESAVEQDDQHEAQAAGVIHDVGGD